jgi:hypothetical protein
MPSNSTKISKPKRDRTNENFSKCIESLFGKSNKLTKYHADIYLLVRRKGDIWEYKSLDCKCWPLSSSAIVSSASEIKESVLIIRSGESLPLANQENAKRLHQGKKS